MAKLTIIIIPKCTGSIPVPVITGTNNAVSIIIAAIFSINVATDNTSKLNNKIIPRSESALSAINVATEWGICSRVKIVPKIEAIEINNKITADVTADDTQISLNAAIFNSV